MILLTKRRPPQVVENENANSAAPTSQEILLATASSADKSALPSPPTIPSSPEASEVRTQQCTPSYLS